MYKPLLLALASLPLSILPCSALDLIGYWNFNGQTDDQSGNGANATLVNDAVISADALGFSSAAGDSALDLGPSEDGATEGARAEAIVDLNAATTNNSMAVSFWQFDIGDGAGGNAATTAFGILDGDSGRGFGTHTPWSDGNVYFDHAGCCAQPAQRLVSNVGITLLNGWHHIVLQVNDGNKQIWIDGNMIGEHLTGAAAVPTFTGTVIIGAQFNLIHSFGGRLDEFAIWDEALSAGQIARLFSGEAATALLDTTDADEDDLLDSFEQRIIDADAGDAINTLADVLPGDDFDSDGLSNLDEQTADTDPTNPDSDGDTLLDGIESNSGTFVSAATDTGTNPLNPDTDGDGLRDDVEDPTEDFVDANQPGTDPNLPDTDGDGFDDKLEIDNGSDPTDFDSRLGSDELELLGYWDFDDNTDPASAPEITGNSPAAALIAPAVFTADAGGHSGNAGDLALDLGTAGNMASAQVPIGDHLKLLEFNNAVAVSFWQKNTDIAASTSSFWFTPGRTFQAHIPWGDGTLYFDHAYTTGNAVARFTITDTVGSGLLVADQWQHLLLQKDAAGNRQIYIDGVLQGNETSGNANPLPAFDGGITIGGDSNLGNSFPGSIDEFAVFSLPLDQEQITRLATGTPAGEILQPAAPFVITSLSIGDDGRVTVSFNARTSVDYAVEVSSDLKAWTELTDNATSDTGSITYKDELTAPGAPRLYYRAAER